MEHCNQLGILIGKEYADRFKELTGEYPKNVPRDGYWQQIGDKRSWSALKLSERG